MFHQSLTTKGAKLLKNLSKNNSTQNNCNASAKFEHMYRITWDRFVNTKLYKYNKNSWIKIDG